MNTSSTEKSWIGKYGHWKEWIHGTGNSYCNTTELHTIDLSHNNIGSEGVDILARGLTKVLHTLNLSGNDIGNEGVDNIVAALSKISHLQKMILFHNRLVTAKGCTSLIILLEAPNSNLE